MVSYLINIFCSKDIDKLVTPTYRSTSVLAVIGQHAAYHQS